MTKEIEALETLDEYSDEEYAALMKLAEFMTSPEQQLFYHNMSGYAAVTYSAKQLTPA